jgi:sugar/nucleoside kinase (ribokinase family)
MKKGIALAGNICVDYVKTVDGYPTHGMLCSILSVSRTTGGMVPNTGIVLRKLDPSHDVLAAGIVGDDENGEYALAELASSGMDVSRVIRMQNVLTSFTDAMTDCNTGERTLFTAKGSNDRLSFEHIDFDSLGGCTMFHIAYALLMDAMDATDTEYGTVMARTLAEASRRGMATSMDVVSAQGARFVNVVAPSLKYCDSLIINEVEAYKICGVPARDGSGRLIPANFAPMCRTLLDMGVRRLAAVHAPEGAWCMERAGDLVFRPSFLLPEGYIKSTVGAGDAFCAGMLYSLNIGFSAEKALDIGAASAACVLGQGKPGMKPIGEIEKMLSEMPRREML